MEVGRPGVVAVAVKSFKMGAPTSLRPSTGRIERLPEHGCMAPTTHETPHAPSRIATFCVACSVCPAVGLARPDLLSFDGHRCPTLTNSYQLPPSSSSRRGAARLEVVHDGRARLVASLGGTRTFTFGSRRASTASTGLQELPYSSTGSSELGYQAS